MSSRVELKAKAKQIVHDNLSTVIKTMLIYFVLVFITTMLDRNLFAVAKTGYVSVFTTILTVLTGFGLLSFYFKLARGDAANASYKDIFSKCKMAIPYFLIMLVTGIFVCLWSILFIIPGIIAAFKYSMATYLYLDDPSLGVMGSINKSKEITNGHKMDLFALELSFIGWFILGMLTLGILYLWIIPYLGVSVVLFYDEIAGNNKKPVESPENKEVTE